MAFPPGIAPKTVTIGIGSFFNGDIVSGTATISAPVNVVHTPSNRPIFSGDMPRTFVDGQASWDLVPTDAPGLNRVDWTYKLKVTIDGATIQPDPIYFTLLAAGPNTVDLDSMVTVPSSSGTPVSVQALTPADLTNAASDLNVAYMTGINVKRYGAKGDGATDDTAAINAALAACTEGNEVFFPAGTYLVSAPIVLKRNRTLRGVHAPRWAYDTGAPSRIKAASNFVGDAIIRLKDEEELFGSVGAAANGQLSGPNDQCGQRILRMTIDGFSVAGGIIGIKASGLVRDVRLVEVCVRRTTGHGITTVSYTRLDGKQYYSRGWALQQVITDTCGNNGFAFNLLNDSTLVDCLAVAATNHGFYLAGAGELLLTACRSVFNKGGHGFYITGSCYGNVVLSGCSTDRNQQHGIFIDATGKQPIMLSGVALRRDGGNNNGGGAGYAGLCVSASTCPVVVAGITTQTGVDDAGAGAWTPQYGMKVTGSASVVVSNGVLWGRDGAISDGGGNTNLRVSNLVVQATGTTVSPTFTYTP